MFMPFRWNRLGNNELYRFYQCSKFMAYSLCDFIKSWHWNLILSYSCYFHLRQLWPSHQSQTQKMLPKLLSHSLVTSGLLQFNSEFSSFFCLFESLQSVSSKVASYRFRIIITHLLSFPARVHFNVLVLYTRNYMV